MGDDWDPSGKRKQASERMEPRSLKNPQTSRSHDIYHDHEYNAYIPILTTFTSQSAKRIDPPPHCPQAGCCCCC